MQVYTEKKKATVMSKSDTGKAAKKVTDAPKGRALPEKSTKVPGKGGSV